MNKDVIKRILEYNGNIKTITLLLTDKCNLRCKYCYNRYWELKEQDNLVMSTKIAQKSIDLLNDDKINVVFSGGEPLLQFALIKKCVDYTIATHKLTSFGVVTNGMLFTREMIMFMKQNNFHVTISIDGIGEYENQNRVDIHGKSTVKKVLSNIKWLIENGIDLSVRMTISKQNVHFLKTIKYLTILGVKNYKLIPVIDPYTENSFPIDIFLKEMKRTIDYSVYKGISLYPFSAYIEAIGRKKNLFSCILCDSGFRSIVISKEGDVYACPMLLNNKFKLGCVHKPNEISQVIFHQGFMDKCMRCEYFNDCVALCYARNHLLTGDMLSPDDNYCRISKFYINQARKIGVKYEKNIME